MRAFFRLWAFQKWPCFAFEWKGRALLYKAARSSGGAGIGGRTTLGGAQALGHGRPRGGACMERGADGLRWGRRHWGTKILEGAHARRRGGGGVAEGPEGAHAMGWGVGVTLRGRRHGGTSRLRRRGPSRNEHKKRAGGQSNTPRRPIRGCGKQFSYAPHTELVKWGRATGRYRPRSSMNARAYAQHRLYSCPSKGGCAGWPACAGEYQGTS